MSVGLRRVEDNINFIVYEPPREKTIHGMSNQVTHTTACFAANASLAARDGPLSRLETKCIDQCADAQADKRLCLPIKFKSGLHMTRFRCHPQFKLCEFTRRNINF